MYSWQEGLAACHIDSCRFRPLVEAKQKGRSQVQLMFDCEELEQSVFRHNCIAASAQVRPAARHSSEQVLHRVPASQMLQRGVLAL